LPDPTHEIEENAMNSPEPTAQQILALSMGSNDSGADTIRGYLIELLATLWRENEEFSGKRPFGNSGWDWDLYEPLVKAKLINGSIDEDGFLDDCDDQRGHELIARAIQGLVDDSSAAA
jgi:hypothetical protein